MLCLLKVETHYLHLILIYLFAGFHRNTSKSQTFSILDCHIWRKMAYQISVTIGNIMEDETKKFKLSTKRVLFILHHLQWFDLSHIHTSALISLHRGDAIKSHVKMFQQEINFTSITHLQFCQLQEKAHGWNGEKAKPRFSKAWESKHFQTKTSSSPKFTKVL